MQTINITPVRELLEYSSKLAIILSRTPKQNDLNDHNSPKINNNEGSNCLQLVAYLSMSGSKASFMYFRMLVFLSGSDSSTFAKEVNSDDCNKLM